MPQSNSKPTQNKKRKRKRKKVKYRKIGFKFTDAQKKALDRYCSTNNTTPVRFIKSLVNKKTERYRDSDYEPSFVTENQLKLFDEETSEKNK